MKFSLILTALLSTFIQQGYAYGDRSGICTDDAQAMSASVMGGTNNPALGWTLKVSAQSYTPGQPLEISITGGSSSFSGLLLYAQDSTGKHVGEFKNLPSGYQTLDSQCASNGGPKSTLSHSSDGKRSSGKFTWTAPAAAAGTVEFHGIIVGESISKWMVFTPLSVSVGSAGGAGAGSGSGNSENNDSIAASGTPTTSSATQSSSPLPPANDNMAHLQSIPQSSSQKCRPRTKPADAVATPPPSSYGAPPGDRKGCKRRK